MKFIIDNLYTKKDAVLKYIEKDYSFMTTTNDFGVYQEFLVNDLCVASCNDVDGFCNINGLAPKQSWIKSSLSIFPSKKLNLLTNDPLPEYGVSRINSSIWPFFFDETTGWVCCGNKDYAGYAIQFTEQAIAVLGNNNVLMSIWLHPLFC